MNGRLQQFLLAENISQSQFADRIGVGRASISHILAGRNKPGYEFLENLARAYPNLNLEWLLLGKGKMYKTSPDAASPPEACIPFPAEPPALQEDPAPSASSAEPPCIEKIVIFYTDGTYKEVR